jgi:hypothetical protein
MALYEVRVEVIHHVEATSHLCPDDGVIEDVERALEREGSNDPRITTSVRDPDPYPDLTA